MSAERRSVYIVPELDPNSLKLDRKPLASGFYGSVFYGQLFIDHKLNRPKDVAVKMLHDGEERTNLQMLKQLREAITEEMHIMSRIGYHPNVLQLIGSMNYGEQLCLITEFCSFGSLDKFISARKDNFVDEIERYSWKKPPTIYKAGIYENWAAPYKPRRAEGIVTTSDLLSYAYQIADGMDFVHSKQVVHRDLALRNILLTSNYLVKIGDFGLSRRTTGGFYQKCQNPLLPFKWTAPEVFFNESVPIESDLYTFGIMLWELFALDGTPYERLDTIDEVINFVVYEGKIMMRPPFAPMEMYNLMISLWNRESNLRPSLKECKRHIMDQLKRACPPISTPALQKCTSVKYGCISSPDISAIQPDEAENVPTNEDVVQLPEASALLSGKKISQSEEELPPQLQANDCSDNQALLIKKKQSNCIIKKHPRILLTLFCTVLIFTVSAIPISVIILSNNNGTDSNQTSETTWMDNITTSHVTTTYKYKVQEDFAEKLTSPKPKPTFSETTFSAANTTVSITTINTAISPHLIKMPNQHELLDNLTEKPTPAKPEPTSTEIYRSQSAAVSDNSTIFFIAKNNSIIKQSMSSLNDSKEILPMNNESIVSDLAFDCQQEQIVWSSYDANKSESEIWSALFNGSDQKLLLVIPREKVERIAIDWSSRNVYYSTRKGAIGVGNLNENSTKVLIGSEYRRQTRSPPLALDLKYRYFFTSFNNILYRVNLNGSGKVRFHNQEIHSSIFVILHQRRELCWMDLLYTQLSCIGLDNQKLDRTFDIPLENAYITAGDVPTSLTALNEERFYWTNRLGQKLLSISIFGDGYTSFKLPYEHISSVRALTEYCLSVETECTVNRGGCFYLSLRMTDGGFSCVCLDNTDNSYDCTSSSK